MQPPQEHRERSTELGWADIVGRLRARWMHLIAWPLAAGLAGLGVAFLIPPTYTAVTVFMPPQQSASPAAAALASLGALSSLAGAGVGVRTPADQYVALMQSTTASDRIIDQFGLKTVYEVELRTDARKVLARNVHFTVGKRDGLISIEVEDGDANRAAAIANHYIEELRRLTGSLAVTEAQQRRLFFERQLEATREKLAQAQRALQSSGFTQGALNSEPKSAAEGYARLRAQIQAAELRLQALRDSLVDDAPEVRQQASLLSALREQLRKVEQSSKDGTESDYVGRFREYKYQETLFEIYARQFELARADESREGSLIQVVDPALVPERRTRPRRGLIAMLTTLASAVLLAVYFALSAPRSAGRPRPSTPGAA